MADFNLDGAVLARQNPWAILNKLSIAEWLRAHGKFVRPELTKKQRLELKECFELIDADGSGAISSSEMLTAFHVLGIRTKRSEVEEMLAEVDADGSGEVEYPEFVQIMTTKMDSQTQEDEPRASKPGKAQPLPFPLLAQAYRRKKLMEAVMQGDKATQERLQARAEEMEQERLVAVAEHEAQTRQVKKRTTSLSHIARERIRKAARLRKKDADLPLPGYILENIDEDVKKILFGVHERASIHRSSISQTRNEKDTEMKEKVKYAYPAQIETPAIDPDLMPQNEENRFTISKLEGGQLALLSKQMRAYYKQELSKIQNVRSKLQDKPTLEQQRIKLQAVQSVGNCHRKDNTKGNNWNPPSSLLQLLEPVVAETISMPWRTHSSIKERASTRNSSHARIVYVPPPKPARHLAEDNKLGWQSHLKLSR